MLLQAYLILYVWLTLQVAEYEQLDPTKKCATLSVNAQYVFYAFAFIYASMGFLFMLYMLFLCFYVLSHALIHFHMFSYAFECFYMLLYANICFQMLSYAFLCFTALFLRFPILSYAFLRFSYAFLPFPTLLHAFTCFIWTKCQNNKKKRSCLSV